MTVHIERLSLQLPTGYATRAEAIGQGVAQGIAQLRATRPLSLAALQLAPVHVGAAASDAQVIQAVLHQLAAALELQS